MHPQLSEWFLAAGIEFQDDVLQKRWAGVEAFTNGRDTVILLVELFFGFLEGKETFLDTFRAPFKHADAAFRMKDNNNELSVLAGAKLASIMEGGDNTLGDLASLAIVSCAAQNLRPGPPVGDIVERAAKHLHARTLSRTQPYANPDATDDTTALLEQVQRDLAAVTEESNVLWWVFGESSRDTGERWSNLSVEQTALMAGKELADLTRIPPGPAASGALLDKVVRFAKPNPTAAQVVLKAAIAALTIEWRRRLIQTFPNPLLGVCPVTHGIKLSIELAQEDAWIRALPSTTRIQRGGKIAPQLLAYQIFLECVLVSLWPKAK